MKPVILLIQIILAGVLVLVILIQQKGAGLGSSFGADMALYRTKRGAEKFLFRTTIVISALFIIASIAGLIL